MFENERVYIEHEGGHAFIYECGGGYSRTGDSQVVAGPDGEPLRPISIYKRGELACGNHAKFAVTPGMIIVRAEVAKDGVWVIALRLLNTDKEYAEYEEITPIPEFLYAAADAAAEKCECYHCRHTHFVAE